MRPCVSLRGRIPASCYTFMCIAKPGGTSWRSRYKPLRHYNCSSTLAEQILKERFKLESFRLEQAAAINRIIGGQSAVVVFPTGGGKSLCYQVPALAIRELDRQTKSRSKKDGGVSVVLSPLIALMKDQVDALRRLEISAAVLDSTQTRETVAEIKKQLAKGKLDLLYCAPERLDRDGILASPDAIRGGIRLLAVDEAHCISEWGHSFRPDYLKIAQFAKTANVERVVCLTATATAAVAKDIREAFDIPPEGLFVTSMYRSNLQLSVKLITEELDQFEMCADFLRENPGPSIIYVTTRANTVKLATWLNQQGFKAKAYHAGMHQDIRADIQDAFLSSDDTIIVSTIAFGMGIDKKNVRTIVHFDLPSSIQAYSQQIGRAGRDGQPSRCMLYLSHKDFFLRNVFIHGDRPSRLALEALFKEIWSKENCLLSPGDTFSVAMSSQSRLVDIKETALSIVYAYLELKFNLFHACTPQYSDYKYHVLKRNDYESDTSPAAKAVRSRIRRAIKWIPIDVDEVAVAHELSPSDITEKLDSWAESGVIRLQKSGVVRVFRLWEKLPQDKTVINGMLDQIEQQIIMREKQDLQRVQDLVNLVTGATCLTRALAAYFTDTTHASIKECGHCTWCQTHRRVALPEFKPKPPDMDLVKMVVDKCTALCDEEARRAKSGEAPCARQALANSTAKNDPRLMACVAFGIMTPRIINMQLWRYKSIFKTMSNCNFDELVAAFKEIIE